MDHSTALSPAASPRTFLFVAQDIASQGNDRHSAPITSNNFSDFDPRTLRVREAARQRWEELKPIIQRVYIEEDRAYPYLAHLLRTQHGFETTYDYDYPTYLNSFGFIY
jgi:hypothetical protein